MRFSSGNSDKIKLGLNKVLVKNLLSHLKYNKTIQANQQRVNS